ncbi:hypothetical protein FOZG_17347 [Fusarium oxysporum Fo47]|uniref:Uncharacterized protein n=1 Tax=Fusarium oxysporum Fo47 TaxID=660027 RepID=W9JHY9_FUSOX|nr:hypothetical protein FOZG_17347 [Fusarium oxysporum Fo47]
MNRFQFHTKQYPGAVQFFDKFGIDIHLISKYPKDVWHCLPTYTTNSLGSPSLSAPLLISISSWSILTAASISSASLNTPARSGLLFPFGTLIQLLMHSHASTILAGMLLLSHLTCRLAPEKICSASVDMGGMQNMSIAIRQRRGKFSRWVGSSHHCKAVCCPIPTCEPCEVSSKPGH